MATEKKTCRNCAFILGVGKVLKVGPMAKPGTKIGDAAAVGCGRYPKTITRLDDVGAPVDKACGEWKPEQQE